MDENYLEVLLNEYKEEKMSLDYVIRQIQSLHLVFIMRLKNQSMSNIRELFIDLEQKHAEDIVSILDQQDKLKESKYV